MGSFIDSPFIILLCKTLKKKKKNDVSGLLAEVREDPRREEPISPLATTYTLPVAK